MLIRTWNSLTISGKQENKQKLESSQKSQNKREILELFTVRYYRYNSILGSLILKYKIHQRDIHILQYLKLMITWINQRIQSDAQNRLIGLIKFHSTLLVIKIIVISGLFCPWCLNFQTSFYLFKHLKTEAFPKSYFFNPASIILKNFIYSTIPSRFLPPNVNRI